jgi:hypothetical protein
MNETLILAPTLALTQSLALTQAIILAQTLTRITIGAYNQGKRLFHYSIAAIFVNSPILLK